MIASPLDRRQFLALSAASLAAAVAPAMPRSALAQDGSAPPDIDIIRGALALHPGLYRYNSPRQIDRKLEVLGQELAGAPDQAAAFVALQRFLSQVRCGHTHTNFYNQSDSVAEALFNRPTRLPFRFTWIGRQMIVLGDDSGSGQLVPGTQIISVNGRPAADLLDMLLPLTRADGGNDGKRRAQLAMRNTDRFEYFDIFQGLLAPPAGGEHQIVFRPPGGARQRLSVPAIDMTARRASLRVPPSDTQDRPLWTWEMRGDVAVLTMPTWVMYNTNWDWRAWLDDRLATLGSGVRGLVMDLRDNEGGNECGNVILSRLAARDYQFEGYRQWVRFRQTPAWLDPYLDTWDRSFRRIGEGAQDLGNGFFQLPGASEETDFIPAMGPRLTVPVAALVSPTCSSATFSFARRAQESGLVRLFGETTGGNLRGINGGAYFFVRLPGCGLEFDVPLIGYFPPSPKPDRGVHPDVLAAPTAEDIAAGRDRAMEAATDWIMRG